MRALPFVLALGLAACSGLPPQPVVPLATGEAVFGLSLDVPVAGPRPNGALSLWAGVGVGQGVDLSFSVLAPVEVFAEVAAVGREGGPFIPPGVAVRKTFAGGAALGLGAASLRGLSEGSGPSRGLLQMSVGPFVSVGSPHAEDRVAARVSAHALYRVRIGQPDSVATARRGLALVGVGAAGPVVGPEGGRLPFGARATVGTWLAGPRAVEATAGVYLEGTAADG